MSINNRDGLVLFDLMTHSADGYVYSTHLISSLYDSDGYGISSSSGVGDHGEAGIATFTDQHICQVFCHALDFPVINPVEPTSIVGNHGPRSDSYISS